MGLLSRKATLGLGDFVHIAIVVVLVLFVFFLGSKLLRAVLGGANQDSLSNFNALADNIEMMLKKPTSFEYQYFTLYLDKDDYIVGLKDISTVENFKARNPTASIEFIYPEKCKQKSCLCLYDTVSRIPSKPEKCRTFDEKIIFHYANLPPVVLPAYTDVFSVPYQDQELFSDYPPEMHFKYFELLLGAQSSKLVYQLYIEKFVENGRVHITIIDDYDSDKIKKRVAMLSLCPSSSDTECIGKRINSNVGSGFCLYEEQKGVCSYKNQQVPNCDEGEITTPCMCGSHYSGTNYPMNYCFRNSAGEYLLLPLDCTDVQKCKDYCTSMTAGSEDCDRDEQYYCVTNPCEVTESLKGCKLNLGLLNKFSCGPIK